MPAVRPEPLFVAFGLAVRGLRQERGMTQEALAERAHIHRTYLIDLEAGRRNVALYNISRLADALGVQPSDLLVRAQARLTSGDTPA